MTAPDVEDGAGAGAGAVVVEAAGALAAVPVGEEVVVGLDAVGVLATVDPPGIVVVIPGGIRLSDTSSQKTCA